MRTFFLRTVALAKGMLPVFFLRRSCAKKKRQAPGPPSQKRSQRPCAPRKTVATTLRTQFKAGPQSIGARPQPCTFPTCVNNPAHPVKTRTFGESGVTRIKEGSSVRKDMVRNLVGSVRRTLCNKSSPKKKDHNSPTKRG